jgi:hypothetical protein
MLPVKPLSGFSCGLEVSHKALLISYETESAIIIVPPHGQSQPVQFPLCELSSLLESCASADKAMVRFCINMKVSHKTLLSIGSQIRFVLQPHRLFFRMHIYRRGSFVKAVILQDIAHMRMHQYSSGILPYFD